MGELLRAGWKTPRIVVALVVGLVLGLAATVVGLAFAAFVAFLVLFAVTLAFYLYSLLIVRFTARGREAWAERSRGRSR